MAITDNIYDTIASALGVSTNVAIAIVVVIAIWSLVWKGIALWKSSRKNQLAWFIVLLVVNTIGILEILYIYVFSEMGKRKPSKDNLKPKKR